MPKKLKVISPEEVKRLNDKGFDLDEKKFYALAFLVNDKENNAVQPIPFKVASSFVETLTKTGIGRPWIPNIHPDGIHIKPPNAKNVQDILDFQRDFAGGIMRGYFINPVNNNASVIIEIFPSYKDIAKQEDQFVSPMIGNPEFNSKGEVFKGEILHIHSVGMSGYDPDIAKFLGTCEGDFNECARELEPLAAAGVLEDYRNSTITCPVEFMKFKKQSRIIPKSNNRILKHINKEIPITLSASGNKKYTNILRHIYNSFPYTLAAAGKFEESEHPRDDSGKFGSGDKNENKNKNNKENTVNDFTKKQNDKSVTFVSENIADKEKIKKIKNIFNKVLDDFDDHDKIIVIDAAPDEPFAGFFQHGIVNIHPNRIPEKHLGAVVVHELAHAKFASLSVEQKEKFGADVLTLPVFSAYVETFKTEFYQRVQDFQIAKENLKGLPKNSTNLEKRIATVSFENANIHQQKALDSLGSEYHSEAQSLIHGYTPPTYKNISSDELTIIKKNIKNLHS